MIPFLQGQEELYLLYIGIALGVFLLVTGLMQLLSRGENQAEARNRRLRMIGGGATTEEVLALLRPPEQTGLLSRIPIFGSLPREMHRAGMTMAPLRFMMLCILGGIAATGVALTFMSPLQAGGIGVLLALVVPLVVVKTLRQKRTDAMLKQLPDALDRMARGLKVGHPLNTSIGSVAREMPDPIGSEFGVIFDQVSYGDDLVSAFQEFADRAGVEDIYYLSVSISIQHGTGGDLARVVEILSKTIRGRISMRRRIKAISSEGRLSALILSLLPFLLFASVSITTPDYYGAVADDPLFTPMLLTIGVLLVANVLILRRLVNFRI